LAPDLVPLAPVKKSLRCIFKAGLIRRGAQGGGGGVADRYDARGMTRLCCRNGGCHEEGGQARPGADRRGEESPLGRLQERDRGEEGLVAHHLLHRTEGGEQRHRRQAGDDQAVQVTGREGAEGHLFRHLDRARQAPHPGRLHR
jgi:hypothetical protein